MDLWWKMVEIKRVVKTFCRLSHLINTAWSNGLYENICYREGILQMVRDASTLDNRDYVRSDLS